MADADRRARRRWQAAIRDGLGAYNLKQAGYRDVRPLAVLVSDPETPEVIGGLLGRTSMGLLFIDVFFLPESTRKYGLGSPVIPMAQTQTGRRGWPTAPPPLLLPSPL